VHCEVDSEWELEENRKHDECQRIHYFVTLVVEASSHCAWNGVVGKVRCEETEAQYHCENQPVLKFRIEEKSRHYLFGQVEIPTVEVGVAQT
jgi:hypothetical protein